MCQGISPRPCASTRSRQPPAPAGPVVGSRSRCGLRAGTSSCGLQESPPLCVPQFPHQCFPRLVERGQVTPCAPASLTHPGACGEFPPVLPLFLLAVRRPAAWILPRGSRMVPAWPRLGGGLCVGLDLGQDGSLGVGVESAPCSAGGARALVWAEISPQLPRPVQALRGCTWQGQQQGSVHTSAHACAKGPRVPGSPCTAFCGAGAPSCGRSGQGHQVPAPGWMAPGHGPGPRPPAEAARAGGQAAWVRAAPVS